MELEVIWSEESQKEKNIYHMILLIWEILNLVTEQKQTHRHRKQIYGYQRGKGGEGLNYEVGIKISVEVYAC